MTKDKPLIEEVVEWINPWGDKESAIPTRKVAEAVKKLKEELCLGCKGKGCSNCERIDKIMGNFK